MTLTGRIFAAIALVAGLNGLSNAGSIEDAISERLTPPGSVCIEGTDCAAATASVTAASSGPRSGGTVYKNACAACHDSGAAGAPKLGDVAAWAPRIGKGIDVLYANAINGIGGMPAKGLCMDCSDDEMDATVDYMVNKSK